MRSIILLLTIITFFLLINKKKIFEADLNQTDPQTISNLLDFHNLERERLDIGRLELSFELLLYAQRHAEWMAKNNSLKHSDISKIKNFEITGENIAWNQQDENEVVTAWMNSTGHRKNMLNSKFKKVGFGIAKNSKNQPYWCTIFGS